VLSEGALDRCVASGSMAASVVLHGLAALIFGVEGSSSDGGGAMVASSCRGEEVLLAGATLTRRQAVLCSAIRRCTAVSGSCAPRRQLLGALLRWDVRAGAAGAAGDMISAERLRFIEGAAGEELLEAALATLSE
jgi:hypothetical protein